MRYSLGTATIKFQHILDDASERHDDGEGLEDVATSFCTNSNSIRTCMKQRGAEIPDVSMATGRSLKISPTWHNDDKSVDSTRGGTTSNATAQKPY